MGFSVIKNLLANARDAGSNPGLGRSPGKIPWRRAWQPSPAFWPGESHAQRSLVGYSPWGCKELDTTDQAHTQEQRNSRGAIVRVVKPDSERNEENLSSLAHTHSSTLSNY